MASMEQLASQLNVLQEARKIEASSFIGGPATFSGKEDFWRSGVSGPSSARALWLACTARRCA
eukprot:1988498-Amphidinium_carterae.1